MQIVDMTPPAYTPMLKATLRDLLSLAPASRLKGIRMIVLEYGPEPGGHAGRATSRYVYKDGQGVVSIHLREIERRASGLLAADHRPWAWARHAVRAVSYPLANHACRGKSDTASIEAAAKKIQAELLHAWSEQWIGRSRLPTLFKRLIARLVEYRLKKLELWKPG